MPPSTPPSRETLVRAFDLYTNQGLTFREVGEEIGVSTSAAERYVKKVQGQQRYVELYSYAEKRLAIDAWLSMAVPYAQRWLDECKGPRDYHATVSAMCMLSKALRDMHGLDKAARVEVVTPDTEGDGDMDIELIAAVHALKRRNEEDRENYRNGGPGVIEGSKRV